MPPIPNSEHVKLLLKGVDVWNKNRPAVPDLPDADLDHLDLRGIDLSNALMWGVNLIGSDLSDAILDNAHLPHASLARARLIGTSVEGADFGEAWVYGAAVWDLRGTPADESWLSITPDGSRYFDKDSTKLRVSGLAMAQFMYAMATRRASESPGTALGGLLNSLSNAMVLLLGRFSAERKVILQSLQVALSQGGSLCPVLFDFEKPSARDLTETVTFLASSSRFIIADLTDPSSVPHELMAIIPAMPSVPVIPIIAAGRREYAMFEHLCRYPWVLPVHMYEGEVDLLAALPTLVERAESLGESRQHR